MNTKLLALLCATAVAGAVLAGPVSSEEIVVSPTTQIERAVKTVSGDLDRKLRTSSLGERNGYAMVRFEIAPDGSPANLRLFHSSGDSAINRGSMRAVKRLNTLDDLAAAVPAGSTIQANIVSAHSDRAFRKMSGKMKAFEEARIAAGRSDSKVFALSTVLHSGG